ncbi:hypothetical protein DUNSADRAFT_14474 [Dunaliella salina]|uniref:Obg domain-containing protein n=1 Tax=Dunaliella salina TaxID=3046 RepID=A0ABQ7H2M2_DUNSA|nr:hypothetical protein DUNSADRAFT_14474 [Dunaliella salina]|eukprot:KAF5841075.1 hypothetical protein DUNSADRAFT_14474 [Dunaliella salina]
MPPASSGIKCLMPNAFLGGRHVRTLAYSAASASHLLQGAQQQLILKKHSCSISETQQSQSPGQSLGSLAQTQSAHAWRHAQASHNQQRHQLLADAAAPASYPAPSAQSLHTAFSGTASQQQHPAYQQQLSRNKGPQQGHQRPLLLQPSLPPQQQLVHHHLLRHHTQRAQCHSWPHQRQQVHHYHFHSHLSCIHHHCLLHQQLQQQQHLRRGMATRSIPFVDQVRMVVEGGKGGNGCVSFAQVARGRRQAASGGNGGDGGSVVLRASRGARELRGLPRVVRGGPGGHGRPNGRTGAHGETRIVDVPVGMVVSLLEDSPLEASELLSPTTTTMQSGTTMEFGTAHDQLNWAPRAVHKDNQTSSTTSLRKRLYHEQDYSDTNIDSSVQRASLQGSPAERDAVSRTDADSFSLLRRDFQAASQADVDSSFPPKHGSQAARGGWPAEEQGAKVPRHNRQSDKSDEPHDKVAIEKGIEKAREGTQELGGPEAAHSQQQGVVAGGGPMWEHRGEEDSEAEECEDDEDDVEVEEDEEEEGEEEFEEGMGWEGGGDDEVGEAEQKPPQRLRVLAELLELGQQEELQAYRACRQEVPLSAFHGVSASNESQAEAALREQGPGESPVQAFELVIANKVDACVRPQQALAELKESTHLPIIPVSALHAAGLERLASALQAAVHSARSRC